MKLRIWKAKLNLYKYLQDLSEDSLAKEIFNEQKKKNFPGLIQECRIIAKELDILDVLNNDKMNKMHFKQNVKMAISKKNEEELRKEILKYSKLKNYLFSTRFRLSMV